MSEGIAIPSAEQTLTVLCDLARQLSWQGRMLNERYLHHAFTHRLQGSHDFLHLTGAKGASVLHPEWPTYKQSTGLTCYGRYGRSDRVYLPTADGTAGFVDFALGRYHHPCVGIEFCLSYGWAHERVVFDLLKLLDRRNPFQITFSFNVIVRDKNLAEGVALTTLEKSIDRAYAEATERLGTVGLLCDADRSTHCVITELASSARRHWYLQRAQGSFARGLPQGVA